MFQGRHEALRGRPARAVASLRRSIRAGIRLASRYELAWAHYWMGHVAQSEEARPHAPEGPRTHFRAALELFEDLDVVFEAAHAREALAECTLRNREASAANAPRAPLEQAPRP